MSINLSKVESIHFNADGQAVVTYKSGQKRTRPIQPDGTEIAAARQAGITITGVEKIPPHAPGEGVASMGEPCDLGLNATEPTSVPKALVEMLILSPDQASHLAGADRLNFWRNGSLNVQVQHGSRSTRFSCPKAIVTDHDLVQFFASWGWQQLSGKLYFRSTPASVVRL